MTQYYKSLYTTSILTPAKLCRSSVNPNIRLRSDCEKMQRNVTKNSGFGHLIRRYLPCFPITEEDMSELFEDEPEYITRHVEDRFLEDIKKGHFRMGTLINYRAKEGELVGRLGDHEESRQQDVINSNTGFIKSAKLPGIELKNETFIGIDKQIVHETIGNDYCSCSSVGKFELGRAEMFRNNEVDVAKKPSAYVTYHLPTLKEALYNYIKNCPELKSFKIVGREVLYGQKDKLLEAEEVFSYKPESNALRAWFDITFIKSPRFWYEDEFRLLLIDPIGPGRLNDDTGTFVIQEDEGIASAIYSTDYY